MQAHKKSPQNFFFKDFKLLTLWYSYRIFQGILEHIFRKHGFTEANSVVQCRCRQLQFSRLPIAKKLSFFFP